MKQLRAWGYEVTRSASSHGLWDVVGVRADQVLLVQCKFTTQEKYYLDQNCKAFRDLPVPPHVKKQLWVYRPRRPVEVIDFSSKGGNEDA